jgi:hypothetical protein
MAKKAAKRPGRGSDKFELRFPDGMRDQLYRLAEANGRSANSEIIERLRQSIEYDNLKSFRDLVEDQDILRTEVAGVRRMVEKLKDDADAFIEKIKQDYPGRYEAILMELKGDQEPER